MNLQALQAKESAPAKKKSSFSWLRPAAARPAAEAEHEAPSASSPAFAHDFTKVPVRPMQLPGVPGFSCPFAPQRCPSGGACHTCPPKLQAKLKIGQPGDRYEQEADRVAETVMRMPEPQVQRKGCSSPGCKDEDEDKILQGKSAGSAGNAQVDHPLIQSVLSSPGQPLDAGTRSFMEPRFGQDFSGVRVHTDGEAAESARAVNARAYTVGRDVVFGEGQYAPGSDEGKRLMAHELVHVGQQNWNNRNLQRQATTNTPVKEHGDINQVPADVRGSCNIAETSPPDEQHITYATDSFILNAATRNILDDFARRWNEDGKNKNVRIDGYASTTGAEDHNWRLSCSRANSVKQELMRPSNGSSGIPEGFLTIYAHGETNTFSKSEYPPNQTATITSDIKVNPTPTPPQLPQPQPICGPDATDWFVKKVNTALSDPGILSIKSEMAAADGLCRHFGTSAAAVAEGGLQQGFSQKKKNYIWVPDLVALARRCAIRQLMLNYIEVGLLELVLQRHLIPILTDGYQTP